MTELDFDVDGSQRRAYTAKAQLRQKPDFDDAESWKAKEAKEEVDEPVTTVIFKRNKNNSESNGESAAAVADAEGKNLKTRLYSWNDYNKQTLSLFF